MSQLDLLHAAGAFGAAFLAGAINSVAGGGTLVTFPTLIWLGLAPVTANATSTVAIWPGSVGSMFGYRRELKSTPLRMLALVIPSLAGGLLGALLLKWTPPAFFDRLVPFLVLFATVLFLLQQPLQRRFAPDQGVAHESRRWLAGAAIFQFLVGLYGGYFGAGIGILMLAALGILGFTDIHQMNGLKNFFGMCINGVAALYFIWARMVHWPYVLLMAIGAVAGGIGGSGAARRLGRPTVRRAVIAIGFVMTATLFWKLRA
jgi:uncharacterized membrane protein YfcA